METQRRITPIIQLWGKLLVALPDDLTDSEAARLTSEVLRTIEKTGATGVVVDASAVLTLDSHLCSLMANLAEAARLMGARAVLCGLNPDTALTLHMMGVELGRLEIARSLEEALESLGIVVEKNKEEEDLWALMDEMLKSD